MPVCSFSCILLMLVWTSNANIHTMTNFICIINLKLSLKFPIILEGEDDDSSQMNDVWQEESVINVCKEKCVCVKLENER